MAFNINTPVQERFTLPGGVRGEIGALGKSVRDALNFLGPIALADFVNPLAGVATANASIMLATASSTAPRQLYPGPAGAAAACGTHAACAWRRCAASAVNHHGPDASGARDTPSVCDAPADRDASRGGPVARACAGRRHPAARTGTRYRRPAAVLAV